jgi:endonuclease/exonuclease/phosphatase family metal-dependent hydrolase
MQARPRWILGLVAGLALALFALSWARPTPIRIATFNVRDFPEHPWHGPGVFAAIAELDASVVAVQEVRDVGRFELDVAHHLGPNWRVEFDSNVGSAIRVGLVHDTNVWEFVGKTSHTEVGGGADQRPALEVRLRARDDDRHLRVFVVHLKAGGKSKDIERRRLQLDALATILAVAVHGSDDEIVVLGDFNATSPQDRERLGEFARRTELSWASEQLECTAYWRPEGRCTGSALDHVFTRKPSTSIAARGPCEVSGCKPGDRCPAFHEWVSDHCPVVAEF